jgi:hypothetical protein
MSAVLPQQGLWFAFPLTFFLSMFGLVDLLTEEWMWTIGDFLGKVMFSSSLLYGNFLTIEQRRLIAMRVVEEGNRCGMVCGLPFKMGLTALLAQSAEISTQHTRQLLCMMQHSWEASRCNLDAPIPICARTQTQTGWRGWHSSVVGVRWCHVAAYSILWHS